MQNKNNLSNFLKTSAVVFLASLALIGISCKKSEQTSTEQKESGKEQKDAQQSSELKPLNIELPNPKFIGTPEDIRSANLGEVTGKSRPPFKAPADAKNVALGKEVTASDMEPIIGELEYATDGDKEASTGSYVELGPGVQWLQVDLGAKHRIYAILAWHYHMNARVYHDVIVQVSDDPDFVEGVKTIFNNDHDGSAGMTIGEDKEWIETRDGKLFNTNPEEGENQNSKGVVARYVRLYSNGSTADDMNHYTEVEVWGEPVK